MAGAAEECPVCLARKPLRVASCKSRHCFCADCLDLLARKHGTLFPCPMCRQPLQIPRSGVSAFPLQCTQKPGSFNLDSVIAIQLHMESVLALAHDGDSAVAHDGDWLLRSGGAESLAVDGAEDVTSHNEDGLPSFDVSLDYGCIYFGSDYSSQQPQSSNYRDFAVEEDSANEGQGSMPPTRAVGVAAKRSSSVSTSLSQPGRGGGRQADRDRPRAERLQEALDRETARHLDNELNGGGGGANRSPQDHLRHLPEDRIRGASRTLQGLAENGRHGALLTDQHLARKLQAEEQLERDRVLAKRLQDAEQRKKEQFERDRALAHRLHEEEEQTRQNGLGFNGGLFQGFS